MTRPTLAEMCYAFNEGATNPQPAPSARARLRLDWLTNAYKERKMPKNLGHIASLARSYTDTAIKTLAGIMMEPNCPPMARVAAAKVLLDRGWGKPKEM